MRSKYYGRTAGSGDRQADLASFRHQVNIGVSALDWGWSCLRSTELRFNNRSCENILKLLLNASDFSLRYSRTPLLESELSKL